MKYSNMQPKLYKRLLKQLKVWPTENPKAAVIEYLSGHHKPRINSVCWVVQISSEQTKSSEIERFKVNEASE